MKNPISYSILSPAEASSDISDIVRLYRTAGWWDPKSDDAKHVLGIIRGSYCFCVAEHGGAVVGMGRVISDGESDSYIQDVTVSSEYRGRGVASEIVRRLVDRLRSDGLTWIALIAEKGSAPLYEKLGFVPMEESVPLLLKGD